MASRDEVSVIRKQGEAAQRVFDAVGPSAAGILRSYTAEPPASPERLLEQVRVYCKEVEVAASGGAVIDLELVSDLAVRCERLLAEVDEAMPDEDRRLVQAAVRYFVEADDAEADVDSLGGFDDDGAVIEAVAIAIGRSHVLAGAD